MRFLLIVAAVLWSSIASGQALLQAPTTGTTGCLEVSANLRKTTTTSAPCIVPADIQSAITGTYPATRSALALVATAYGTAHLTEAGREGEFKWSSSNLSSQVTADTAQCLYVPPSSGPTGASGAWVRVRATAAIEPEWCGAKRDGSTIDTTAINSAVALGDTVKFHAGTYYLGTGTLSCDANSDFEGEGPATIFQALGTGRVGGTDPLVNQALIRCASVNNVTFRNFTLNGDRANQSAQVNGISLSGTFDGAVIDDVTFIDHGVAVAIYGPAAKNVTIRDSRFLKVTANNSGVVTLSDQTSYLQILSNYFGSTDEEAIDLNTGTDHFLIDDNTFFSPQHNLDAGSGTIPSAGEPIDIGGGHTVYDGIVSNNHIYDDGTNTNAHSAIHIKLRSDRITVIGNELHNTRDFTGASMVDISNSRQISVIGNTVYQGPTCFQISDAADTRSSENITITGNTCYDVYQRGLSVNATNVKTLVVSDNTFEALSASTTSDCMTFANIEGLTANGNTCKFFDGDGLSLASTVTYATASGNIIKDNGADGIDSASPGAIFTANQVASNGVVGIKNSGADVTIKDNQTVSNGSSGIALLSGSDRAIVEGNNTRSNTTSGFNAAASVSDVIVKNNQSSSNGTVNYASMTNLDGNSVVAGNIGYVTENFGTASITAGANGNFTITHGLSLTPTMARINLIGDTTNGVDVQTIGATTLTGRVRDSSGADVTSGTFTVTWEASAKPKRRRRLPPRRLRNSPRGRRAAIDRTRAPYRAPQEMPVCPLRYGSAKP